MTMWNWIQVSKSVGANIKEKYVMSPPNLFRCRHVPTRHKKKWPSWHKMWTPDAALLFTTGGRERTLQGWTATYAGGQLTSLLLDIGEKMVDIKPFSLNISSWICVGLLLNVSRVLCVQIWESSLDGEGTLGISHLWPKYLCSICIVLNYSSVSPFILLIMI